MKFSEIKTILYNSDEIKNIPDRWEESIPFISFINGKEVDAFLYWNTCERLEIKLMIGIDKGTGELFSLDKEKIKEIFSVTSLSFSPITIEDYDVYFSDKQRYETLFEGLCLSNDNYALYGAEEYNLLKKIVGQELFDGFFSIVAKDYLSKLSCSN